MDAKLLLSDFVVYVVNFNEQKNKNILIPRENGGEKKRAEL